MNLMSINPVLGREVTQRMRGWRAMLALVVFVGVVGLIAIAVYAADGSSYEGGPPAVTRVTGIGQTMFETTLLLAMILVLFLVPGFTAGAISGERERQTLVPVQVTLLRPFAIVTGKITAALAFTTLLIIATLPLLMVSYLIGGVQEWEVFAGVAMVLFTGLVVAAVSVLASSVFRRVQTSTVAAYAIVLLLVGGTLGSFYIAYEIDRTRGFDVVDPPTIIVAANPLVGLADLLGEPPYQMMTIDVWGGGSATPEGPLSSLRQVVEPGWGGEPTFDRMGNPIPVDQARGRSGFRLWMQYLAIMTGVFAAAVWWACRRVRTPARTER